MPRWEKKEPIEEEKPEESTAENTGLPSNDTNILVRSLSQRVDDLSIAFARMIDAINGHIPMLEVASSTEPAKLQRRRTEDEMRYALRVFANGLPRQRDDDCEAVINDTIGEVLALRQITMDLMQTMSTAHQTGLAAIRKMTER